jgi:tRNA(Ile)-lysidine synthase
MLEATLAFIEQHRLLPAEGGVVVAVSGGADSLCLLHILRRLCGGRATRYPSVRLHVAHLNHLLRGDAGAADALYVAQLAADWGLPVTIGAIDVPALAREEKRSLEEAARVARYRFLRALAGGGRIAVAHHADDQVETILLHWLRGAGQASTAGMPPRQGDLIRPLLSARREEIALYCQQHALQPRQDASNGEARFLRNRVRHELLPVLESLQPAMRTIVLRNAEVARVDAQWIEAQVDDAWPAAVASELAASSRLNVDALLSLPPSIQRHLLRRVTAGFCGGQSPLELRHYILIEQLLRREQSTPSAPKQLDLPGRLSASRNGPFMVIEHGNARRQALFSAASRERKLPLPGRVEIEGTPWTAAAECVTGACLREARQALRDEDWPRLWRLLPSTRHTVYVDGGCSGAEFLVRTRRSGDRIQPLGMLNEKKVQDMLVDARIARDERAGIPLFFSAAHCVWLAGICLDERVKLTRKTQSIIRLSIESRG